MEEPLADQIFGRNSAVRRLNYNDCDDVLGAISQLPDDGKVEEEPKPAVGPEPEMSQLWNQDSESPVPLTQPLERTASAPEATATAEADSPAELEEGETSPRSPVY